MTPLYNPVSAPAGGVREQASSQLKRYTMRYDQSNLLVRTLVSTPRQLLAVIRGTEQRRCKRLVYAWITDELPTIGAIEVELSFVR